MITGILVCLVAILVVVLFVVPRPTLDPRPMPSVVPSGQPITDLQAWLETQEKTQANVITGAEARIKFANEQQPQKTRLAILHIHGFSACRQETAPVAEKIADHFGANLIEVRLAGHGLSDNVMTASAEDWLQSVVNGFDIASQLGNGIIIIGTSTGATLAVWATAMLQKQPDQVAALLLMSPNFKVNSHFDFLLTLPAAQVWIPWILGRERSWQPERDLVAKYWSSRYPIQAIIEMQKVVSWFRKQPLDAFHTPLALMYMKNDPTIDPAAAVRDFSRWGTAKKQLIPVTVSGDRAEHVFAGNLSQINRTAWCVKQFNDFLAQAIDYR